MFDIILGGICAIVIIAFACSIPDFTEIAKKINSEGEKYDMDRAKQSEDIKKQ